MVDLETSNKSTRTRRSQQHNTLILSNTSSILILRSRLTSSSRYQPVYQDEHKLQLDIKIGFAFRAWAHKINFSKLKRQFNLKIQCESKMNLCCFSGLLILSLGSWSTIWFAPVGVNSNSVAATRGHGYSTVVFAPALSFIWSLPCSAYACCVISCWSLVL
jgi:hypothetical protein